MKKTISLVAALVLVAFCSMDAMAGSVTSRFDVSLGGYVKLDYINQSAKLGPLTGPVPADGTLKADQDESLFTARQTRVNLKVTGPECMGAKTTAFIEGDFYGPQGTNESPNFRMRHAYGALTWDKTQVLFGQFWDIFTPMVASTIDFRSGQYTGTPNNPRVPQVRLTHTYSLSDSNALRVIVGAQNPVENFKSDPSTSGNMVNVAGQAMLTSKALGVSPGYWGLPMNPLTIGVFGLYGKEDVANGTTTPADEDTIDVYGYGLYTFVPLLQSCDGKSRAMTLSFEAQGYVAAGLDVIGATATNALGTTGDLDAAKGYGVTGQFIFYPTQSFGIATGYGRRNILDSEDYRDGTDNTYEKYNEQYFINFSYDLSASIRVAAEYQRLKTSYIDAQTGATDSGSANRYMGSAMFFF